MSFKDSLLILVDFLFNFFIFFFNRSFFKATLLLTDSAQKLFNEGFLIWVNFSQIVGGLVFYAHFESFEPEW